MKEEKRIISKKQLREKGITLLSLIITIVLLLIVSGVTLNIAIGDNGLLKKSKEAINKGKLAQTEELIRMDLLSAYIDAELLGMDKPSTETIKKIVESYGGTIDESNPNIIQTPNGEINLDKILGETSSDTNNPDEINKTIENLNNRITELNKALETERNEKKELQNSVNELNGQIEELNTQVARWKKKAEDGEVTIAQRDEAISTLNNQIETKNTEIATKSQRIEELEGNVTTLTNEKSTLETQVVNLNTRIAELEGKQATGNALASDVLAGKTFSTANGVGQTGTMVNRGTLNFNPSVATTQEIQAGFYSGGIVSSEESYNSGYEAGKSINKTTHMRISFTGGPNGSGWEIPDDFGSLIVAYIRQKEESQEQIYILFPDGSKRLCGIYPNNVTRFEKTTFDVSIFQPGKLTNVNELQVIGGYSLELFYNKI